MTDKRFITGDLWIQDNKNGITYFLDEQGGVNALCNLINGLDTKTNRLLKENEQLKTELKGLRKKYNDFSDAVDKRLQKIDKRLLE